MTGKKMVLFTCWEFPIKQHWKSWTALPRSDKEGCLMCSEHSHHLEHGASVTVTCCYPVVKNSLEPMRSEGICSEQLCSFFKVC